MPVLLSRRANSADTERLADFSAKKKNRRSTYSVICYLCGNENLDEMKTKQQIVGARGEQEACNFLLGEGHRIVRRNWRSSHLEVDIITVKDSVLHIVEVKTRSAGAPVRPEVNVNSSKRQRMVKAAGAFLHSPQMFPGVKEVQFDVLTVIFQRNAEPQLEYYPAAFIPTFL